MSKTIGFIGLGNMGSAILHGLKNSGTTYAYAGFDTRENITSSLKGDITPCANLQQCFDISDIVILAVKPNVMNEVLSSVTSDSNTLHISIAAGITIESMEAALGKDSKIIRVMPNTPSLIGKGMSVLAANGRVSQEELDEAAALFGTIGKTLIMPEKLINAVTGVSGCGPAYGYTFIQAMADGGVKMGLSRTDALTLAAQTLLGAAAMVLETGEAPITLRNMVTSPGGSTIAAVHKLERGGISGIIMDAVEEAAKVTEQLGKSK